MRGAVIGVGVIGSVHAAILKERGELCAVCDIDASKLKKYADIPVYTDFKTMMMVEKPDVVHICTPHYLHAEMIIFALSHDINVLCEKPLCIKREDIPAILEAEKNSKARLGVCLQNRYNKENVFVKEYLKDKRVICAVGQVSWHRTKEYYQSAEWRGKLRTEGGGVLINQALHTLDLLQYFAGMPEKITASVSDLTLRDCIEVEDTAVIQSVKGAGLTLYASNGCAVDMPVLISVKTENELIQILPGAVLINGVLQTPDGESGTVRGKECYGSSHEILIADFYRSIENKTEFPINGEEAAKVVRLILSAYESKGEPVDV